MKNHTKNLIIQKKHTPMYTTKGWNAIRYSIIHYQYKSEKSLSQTRGRFSQIEQKSVENGLQ